MKSAPTIDWIMTASGVAFFPMAPRPEDIHIEDIAHHLSHVCRFTGAVREFYSVAQHSVLLSNVLADPQERSASDARILWRDALFGLLHDASEAYMLDLPRPLKHGFGFAAYRKAEHRLQRVIYRRFGLDPGLEPRNLHLFDRRLLRTEQRDLMPPAAHGEVRTDVQPFARINVSRPWSAATARWHFLERFAYLTANVATDPKD